MRLTSPSRPLTTSGCVRRCRGPWTSRPLTNPTTRATCKWQPQGVIGEALSGYTPFDQWPERLKQSYAYDPEGAKKLLKEAGYPNGFKTVLNHFGEFDLSYTELAAEYFRAIGVDVEIRVLDRATFIPLVTEGTMEGMAMTIQGWNHPLVGQRGLCAFACTRPQTGTSTNSKTLRWTPRLKPPKPLPPWRSSSGWLK